MGIAVVLLLSSICFAQSSPKYLDTNSAIAMYHAKEKHPGVGFIAWLFIPGGGEFYAGNPIVGAAFAGAEAGAIALVATHTNQNARATHLALFGFCKVAELVATMNDIGNYNHQLRVTLGLQETAALIQPGIQLSLTF